MHKQSIEKSGTGIEKSGTGIEKSGTGIEKSGTGIEKSGTGIKWSVTCALFMLLIGLTNISIASSLNAQVVKQGDSIAIVFAEGNSQLVGVGLQKDGYMISPIYVIDSEGGGTGNRTSSEGGGTGNRTSSEGGGTGNRTSSEGGGTGQKDYSAPWGYAEIALNGDTASVIIYQDNARGGLVERAALELPVFEKQ